MVTPESVRLPLSDGDFITVKKELNAGEGLDLEAERTRRRTRRGAGRRLGFR